MDRIEFYFSDVRTKVIEREGVYFAFVRFKMYVFVFAGRLGQYMQNAGHIERLPSGKWFWHSQFVDNYREDVNLEDAVESILAALLERMKSYPFPKFDLGMHNE